MALVLFGQCNLFPLSFSPFFFRVCPTLPSTRELFARGFEVFFSGGGVVFFSFVFQFVDCAICLPVCLSLVQVEGFVSGSTSLTERNQLVGSGWILAALCLSCCHDSWSFLPCSR